MSTMTAEKVETLDVCFGTYPHTQPLKNGDIKSDRVALRFNEVNPINKAFLMMVRQMKFDVSEMAIATYLQAKAYGKPMRLDAGDDVRALSARHDVVQFRARHGDARKPARPANRGARVLADHGRVGCAGFSGRITASISAK